MEKEPGVDNFRGGLIAVAGAGRAAWTRLLVVAHSWLRGELLSLCCFTENSEEFLFPPPLLV